MAQVGTQACVKGWVRTKRISKNIVFIALNDGSVLHNLQVVTAPSQLSEATLQSITPGSSLCVEGVVTTSQGQARESFNILVCEYLVFPFDLVVVIERFESGGTLFG